MTALWNFLISRARFMEYVNTTQKFSFSSETMQILFFEWIFGLVSSKDFATIATWVAIMSYFGALQLIQTAYRVSILTLISCTEKEEGQSPMPHFGAIIDNFSQLAIHLNHYIRHFRVQFHCLTFRKHGSQCATELPPTQHLKEQGIQKYSWHRK